jgi:N-acetylneuraminic acid mutarotase
MVPSSGGSAEKPDISGMTWTGIAGLAYGFHHDAIAYGGEAHWIGGYGGGAPLSTFATYNPVTNTWGSTRSLRQGRMGHTSLMLGSKLYICAGTLGNTTAVTGLLESYDFATGLWETLAPCPVPHRHGDGCVVNGKLYYFSGIVAASGDQETPTSFVNHVYDPVTNTWAALGLPISGRLDCGVVAHKGKIYILGGRRSSVYQKELYQFDPMSLELVAKEPPPVAFGCRRSFHSFRGYLVSLFGFKTPAVSNEKCYRYDPDKNTWEEWGANAGIMRGFGGSAAIGTTIYYFSGIRGANGLSDSIKFA